MSGPRPPRFTPAKGTLFTRAPWLSGRYKVYFGPDHDLEFLGTYAPPTLWPAVGSLVQRPQVVWLSAVLPSTGLGADYPYGSSGETNTLEEDGSLVTVLGPALTSPNHFYIETMRLLDLYREVRDRLLTLRKNRTYAVAVSWFDDTLANDTHIDATAHGVPPLIAPPAAAGDYLATDFLHIYAGSMATDVDGERFHASDGNYQSDPFFDITSASDMRDDPVYQAALAAFRLARADYRKRRGRHATRLYPYDLDWSDMPDTYEFVATDGNTGDSTPATRTNLVKPPLVAATARNRALLQALADDLTADQVQVSGTSNDLTADTIMQAIADYFRFDPDTGKDRPAS